MKPVLYSVCARRGDYRAELVTLSRPVALRAVAIAARAGLLVYLSPLGESEPGEALLRFTVPNRTVLCVESPYRFGVYDGGCPVCMDLADDGDRETEVNLCEEDVSVLWARYCAFIARAAEGFSADDEVDPDWRVSELLAGEEGSNG